MVVTHPALFQTLSTLHSLLLKPAKTQEAIRSLSDLALLRAKCKHAAVCMDVAVCMYVTVCVCMLPCVHVTVCVYVAVCMHVTLCMHVTVCVWT